MALSIASPFAYAAGRCFDAGVGLRLYSIAPHDREMRRAAEVALLRAVSAVSRLPPQLRVYYKEVARASVLFRMRGREAEVAERLERVGKILTEIR